MMLYFVGSILLDDFKTGVSFSHLNMSIGIRIRRIVV